MNTNLLNINQSGTQLTTAGGNLMNIAAKQYGDAMAWTTIAQANKLSDPVIDGVKTIVIPPKSGSSDGVLNG